VLRASIFLSAIFLSFRCLLGLTSANPCGNEHAPGTLKGASLDYLFSLARCHVMGRLAYASIVALGVVLLIGGACSFLDGVINPHDTHVGPVFGPLAGIWHPNDYRFLGAVLASAGGGLMTFGLLMRRPPDGDK
jgi:hypothetical protein